jgi:hypothetical protein
LPVCLGFETTENTIVIGRKPRAKLASKRLRNLKNQQWRAYWRLFFVDSSGRLFFTRHAGEMDGQDTILVADFAVDVRDAGGRD